MLRLDLPGFLCQGAKGATARKGGHAVRSRLSSVQVETQDSNGQLCFDLAPDFLVHGKAGVTVLVIPSACGECGYVAGIEVQHTVHRLQVTPHSGGDHRIYGISLCLLIRVTSHQLFQQPIGSLPAMIDCSPGQAQLFADLPICQLQEPVHQKDIPEALGQNGQRVSQPVVLNEDHIAVHREGCVFPRIEVISRKLTAGIIRQLGQGHEAILLPMDLPEGVCGFMFDRSLAENIKGVNRNVIVLAGVTVIRVTDWFGYKLWL